MLRAVHTPTEGEVRAALAAAWADPDNVDRRILTHSQRLARSGVVKWEDGWSEVTWTVQSLYNIADMPERERDRLAELVYRAIGQLRNEARARLAEALVEATMAFAAEYPDAERATE